MTRGQTAKIVANAAGFPDAIPSQQQTFADVPPGNPFWVYIERLAAPGRVYQRLHLRQPAGPCVLPAIGPTSCPAIL